MSDELDLAKLKALAEEYFRSPVRHSLDACLWADYFPPPTVLALIEAAEQRDALQSRLASALARIGELTEALRPFGAYANWVAAEHPGWDHDGFKITISGDPGLSVASLRPFRAAARVLDPQPEPETQKSPAAPVTAGGAG